MDWLKSYGIGSISEPPKKPKKPSKPIKTRKLSGTKTKTRKLSGTKTKTRKLSQTKRFAVSGNRILTAHKSESGSGYYVKRRDSNGNPRKFSVKSTFASSEAASKAKANANTKAPTKRRTSGKSRRR
jgi:hypothetical protein